MEFQEFTRLRRRKSSEIHGIPGIYLAPPSKFPDSGRNLLPSENVNSWKSVEFQEFTFSEGSKFLPVCQDKGLPESRILHRSGAERADDKQQTCDKAFYWPDLRSGKHRSHWSGHCWALCTFGHWAGAGHIVRTGPGLGTTGAGAGHYTGALRDFTAAAARLNPGFGQDFIMQNMNDL